MMMAPPRNHRWCKEHEEYHRVPCDLRFPWKPILFNVLATFGFGVVFYHSTQEGWAWGQIISLVFLGLVAVITFLRLRARWWDVVEEHQYMSDHIVAAFMAAQEEGDSEDEHVHGQYL